MTEQFPVIINLRDRITPLLQLISWLEAAGQEEIWLCDNDSTYPPLVEYLKSTRHHVVYNKFNLGKRAPWLSGMVPEIGHGRFFIVTDPDVVPTDECPMDVLKFFKQSLLEHPSVDIVGFSLKLDDLPDHYAHKRDVLAWEHQFWVDQVSSKLYRAPIDTTFAMYRPGNGHRSGNALRSAPPYEARHMPWYQDSQCLSDEDIYYASRADMMITNWNDKRIPANVQAKLRKLSQISNKKVR